MTSQFCLLRSLPYTEQTTILASNKPHTRQMNHSQYKYKMVKSKYVFRTLSCVCTDIVFLWDSSVRVQYHNRTVKPLSDSFYLANSIGALY